MKTQLHQIDKIKQSFERVRTQKGFIRILNEAQILMYNKKTAKIELEQLTRYAFINETKSNYISFLIKKKSGQDRTIHAPVKGLLSIQRALSYTLQCVFEPHRAAMGFVRNKSIVDNAKMHEGSKFVYNIDLKDFFHSIDQARIWKCLQLHPFYLNLEHDKKIRNELTSISIKSNRKVNTVIEYLSNAEEELADGFTFLKLSNGGKLFYKLAEKNLIYILRENSDLEYIKNLALRIQVERKLDEDIDLIKDRVIRSLINKGRDKDNRLRIANLIASLCCTEMEVERKNQNGEWEKVKRNVLPQGAPTSPVITNIVCQRLDHLLSGVAKRFGLKYSRYADDITFSSMHNVYQADSEFLKELHRIVIEQGFQIKESKTRLQRDGYRKEVTGLLVNDKVNVQQRYIKQLRMWLYYWERYGYDKASEFFLQQYIFDKGNVMKGKPNMTNVIAGKLDFLKMVKGADNELYLKLKGRFDALSGTINPLEEILNIWENKGIDVAMNHYYKVNTK
jgi:hypothetical protein